MTNHNTDDIYAAAARYWGPLVNPDRTRLEVLRKPDTPFEKQQAERVQEAMDLLKESGYPVIEMTIEPEEVGEYLMAYDPERDTLYVWDEDHE